jgi:phosphohistidine phosphatase
MDRLILMRHAKAEKRSKSGEDFDRALTDTGREDAAIMGRVLEREGLVPDVVIVSAAKRTRETAEAAFPALKADVRRDLYNAPALALLEAAEAAEGTVLVVGHNPGVHELVLHLLVDGGAGGAVIGRAGSRFPTATAAAFLVDAGGRPSYDGLFFVTDHGGGDGE